MGTHTTSRRFHGTSCSADCTFFVDLMVRVQHPLSAARWRFVPTHYSGCVRICVSSMRLLRRGLRYLFVTALRVDLVARPALLLCRVEQGGPCGRQDCSVCSICTHGFKLRGFLGRTAQRTSVNLRYGEGLYFSSVSGKANDYAFESEKVRARCFHHPSFFVDYCRLLVVICSGSSCLRPCLPACLAALQGTNTLDCDVWNPPARAEYKAKITEVKGRSGGPRGMDQHEQMRKPFPRFSTVYQVLVQQTMAQQLVLHHRRAVTSWW